MITRLVLLPDTSAPARRPVARQGSQWRWALGLARVGREFPTVEIEIATGPAAGEPIRVRDWQSFGFDPCGYDAVFRAQPPSTVYLAGPRDGETASTALQVLTRYQGLVARRNRASSGPAFDALLARHRALHDLTKPLVAADFWHALDTWQWTLRLAPQASLPLQVAALFHDIERLTSEADTRVEHLAPDYQAFKNAHARQGAALAAGYLRASGITGEDLGQTLLLIADHEVPDDDRDRAVLADADALSFLALNSAGYLDYFGPEQMRRKVAYTLRRLRRETVRLLAGTRLRADVERIVVSELVELAAEARGAAPAYVVEPAPVELPDTVEALPAANDTAVLIEEAAPIVAVPEGPAPLAEGPPALAPPPSRPAVRLAPAANTDREQPPPGRARWRETHGGVIEAGDLDLLDDALDALERTDEGRHA